MQGSGVLLLALSVCVVLFSYLSHLTGGNGGILVISISQFFVMSMSLRKFRRSVMSNE